MTVSKMICGSKVNTLLCFPFSGLYPGCLKHRYTGLGAQTRCPKNHKWHRTSYAKCAHSIIAFRVLKNHPLNVLKIVPQNARNGISKTLNFKIFRGGMPPIPTEGSCAFSAFLCLQRLNVVTNSLLTDVPKLSLDTALISCQCISTVNWPN